MKDFEKVLLNAMIYGYGVMLSKCPPSEIENISREIGSNLISYLKEFGMEFRESDTVEDTVANIISSFVEKGFVEDVIIDPTTEKGMYCKWVNLVGIEAFSRLYRETGSAFISCPLSMIVMAVIGPMGYRVRVNGIKFDLESKVAETWEDFEMKRVRMAVRG